MPEVKIEITRSEGNLGISVKHRGIYDACKEYEDACGNLALVREDISRLLDYIEKNDRELLVRLRAISNDETLPDIVRMGANKELNRRER